MRPRVLTVAGSDPSGGAGVQADLETFAAWRCRGMAVLTALTAQSPRRVAAIEPAGAAFVGTQIDVLLEDCPPDAVKTGMLFDAATAVAAADRLARRTGGGLVVDPVLRATSGADLAEGGLEDALLGRLVPLADLVTPNAAEAAVLTGLPVRTEDDAWRAAEWLATAGARAVLVKGGHLGGAESADLLLEAGGERTRFARARIAGARPHGAGCTLSAAIACGLAHGLPLRESVRRAGDWVHAALAASAAAGDGVLLDRSVPVAGGAA